MRMGDRFESPNLSNAVGLISILIRGSGYDFPKAQESENSTEETPSQVDTPANPFKIEPEVNINTEVLRTLRNDVRLFNF